jgi:hypothetical protein
LLESCNRNAAALFQISFFRMIEMIRHSFCAFALLCFSGSIFCSGPAAAESAPAAACLYQSRTYSDGAYICVQKSLMLTCSSDGPRASWKVVTDRDLSERCVGPTALIAPAVLRRHARRTRMAHRRSEPPQQASAKCFSFNNKQYCE